MSDPSRYRDSTQVVLPVATLEAVRDDLEAEFTVTVEEGDDVARVIGSPVVIKEVNEFLARQGVPLP